MRPNIRVEQYQIAADQTVSIGGIKWLTKYDVRVQFSDRDIAYAMKSMMEKFLQGEAPQNPLTDGWILGMWPDTGFPDKVIKFARAIEAAHGIKGGA